MENNEELISAIFNVGRLIKEKIYFSNCLKGFTNSEFEALKFVGNNKNVTTKSVADYLHIKPSSVTPVIDGLVKMGSIKRFQSKSDRRVVYIVITSKGLQALQNKYKTTHKIIVKVFKKLNKKDKKNFTEILNKLNK